LDGEKPQISDSPNLMGRPVLSHFDFLAVFFHFCRFLGVLIYFWPFLSFFSTFDPLTIFSIWYFWIFNHLLLIFGDFLMIFYPSFWQFLIIFGDFLVIFSH
jgi:hypothetical protein